jgi:Arc/MetJ-type ribon-helix-helix transcriptional regulator
MLFDQPAWAERLQQMGVGRRLDPKEFECRVPLHASAHHDALDPKEFEARGAVDYLVRQLRYVSMDEGVRASCELWKRTVLEEADGLGAVLAAVREAEIEAEIEAATKADAKVDVKVEVNAAEV